MANRKRRKGPLAVLPSPKAQVGPSQFGLCRLFRSNVLSHLTDPGRSQLLRMEQMSLILPNSLGPELARWLVKILRKILDECGRRFLQYEGNSCDAGVLPASFCVVGSREPPFSVTQLISTPPQLPILEHAVASAAPAASYKSPSHSLTPTKRSQCVLLTISLIYRESFPCAMGLAEDAIVSQPSWSPTEHVPSIENRLRVRGT